MKSFDFFTTAQILPASQNADCGNRILVPAIQDANNAYVIRAYNAGLAKKMLLPQSTKHEFTMHHNDSKKTNSNRILTDNT